MNQKKKIFSTIIPIVSIFIVFGVVISSNQVENLGMALKKMNPFFILLSIVVVLAGRVVEAYVLKKIAGRQISFMEAVNVVMAGVFFNAITPFASGGQPAQLYMLHRKSVSIPQGATILARKFMIYQSVLVLYSLLVVIFESSFFMGTIPQFIFFGFIGFLINVFVIVMLWLVAYRYRFTRRTIVRFNRALRKKIKRKKSRKKLTKFIRSMRAFHKQMEHSIRSSNVVWLGAITFLQLTLYYGVTITIAMGFGLTPIQYIHMISAAAFVSMITAFIPIPGASLGAEGSFYVFFKVFFPSDLLMSALILWRSLTFYLPLLIGWIVVLIESKKYGAVEN